MKKISYILILIALGMSQSSLSAGILAIENQGDGSAWLRDDFEIDVAGGHTPDYFTSVVGLGDSSDDTISQTFEVTSDFTLGRIDIAYTNGSAGTVGVRLQEVTVALNGGSTAYGYSLGTDLLSGVSFDLTVANTGVNILTLNLTGADQVALTAGKSYAIEFVNTGVSDGSFGLRRRGGSYYADGMVFSNRVSVNGTATRDAGMRIYAIPEASSFLLALTGFLGMVFGIKRKRHSV